MDGLITHGTPESRLPIMVVAFAGWPDAAEAASVVVHYLVKKLPAKKFASVDPEEFYDFTVVRPQTEIDSGGERIIRWPINDFYYYAPEDKAQGLLLYAGTEPNLRWRAFSDIVTDVAQRHGVELVISLGALLDAVPHSREPRVTGRASSPELAQKVEWLGIRESGYQGPTGIHSAFMAACNEKGLAHANIWGHCPHYINKSPNLAVGRAILSRLRSLVDFTVDLEELNMAAQAFEAEVTESISKQPDISAYVLRLEECHDKDNESSSEIPSSRDMVKDLEEFLKSQQQPGDRGDP